MATGVELGRYLILNTPLKSFEYNVRDKFQKVIPEDLRKEVNLEETFNDLSIATLVPRIKDDGDYDGRYKRGLKALEEAGVKPAAAKAEASPAKLQKETTGSRGAPTKYNLEKNYIATLVTQYHLDQLKLFPDSHDTTLEFIKKIDDTSKSVMEEYKSSVPETSMSADGTCLRNEIEICLALIVQRLAVHMNAENDLMTGTGYRVWRDHTVVIASFAVYYVSLQLLRKKIFGSFY